LNEILPLYEYNESKAEKYAVLIVRGQDAKLFFYIPEIDDYRSVSDVTRSVRNRHRRGGFSQNRYQRLREGEIRALVKKVGELCEDYCFSEDGVLSVRGIILVGNGDKKSMVGKYLTEILDIPNSVVSTLTTDGTIEKSQEEARKVICYNLQPKEQRLAEKEIGDIIVKNPDTLVFGRKEVAKGLRDNTLRKVFLLKGIYGERMQVILDENTSAEKIFFSVSPLLEMYGSCIGVLWY
jgi:peptide chain release factor subunit 1